MDGFRFSYNFTGYLGPTMICMALLIYFIRVKRKTIQTRYLILFYFFSSLFGSVVCFRLMHVYPPVIPLAPLSNVGSAGFTFCLFLFVYHFPKNNHTKESRIISIQDRHWITIGDVSGHGVSAGLIMMMVQTAIHVMVNKYPDILPSDFLVAVNRTLTNNIKLMSESKYMTLNVLRLDSAGRFVFSGLHPSGWASPKT